MSERELLQQMRQRHPHWIFNRSDNHTIIGVPGSLEGLKTVVEPGNCFSPGPGSYGVSTWVYDRRDGSLHAPERLDLASVSWRFLHGRVPVLVSTWRAGPLEVESRLFARGGESPSDVKDFLILTCRNVTDAPADATLYLVVRSFGPAGGPIHTLAFDGRDVLVNGALALRAESVPDAAGALSYQESRQDIGELLAEGRLPETHRVEDPSTWASGALLYDASLAPGEERILSFVCAVRQESRFLTDAVPLANESTAAAAEAEISAAWTDSISIDLDLPDERFADALYAQILHLSMFTVGDTPRISPVAYPIFWLRDGAYVVTALDRAGMHTFAAAAIRRVMHLDAFGGFGSEGDGPGQLMWMIGEHYLLTRDREFLAEAWPHVLRLGRLLSRMRTTAETIRTFTEYVMPQQVLSAESDVMCLPADRGLIQGRMDHDIRPYWCSGWGWLGLDCAAHCARELGHADVAAKFERERDALHDALRENAAELFGGDARDVNSALWPAGWARGHEDAVREAYRSFWTRERFPDGRHRPEPLWTYFEAGQAHNYLLLGERDIAWVSIEHFLSTSVAPGLFTYHEGDGDENSFSLWERVRGWDRIRYVAPHGWTGAELFHLLRECLVREDRGDVAIGSGVPQSWVDAGRPFAVRNLPTHAGRVSWRYDPSARTLQVAHERPIDGRIVCAIPGAEDIEVDFVDELVECST